jgi:hypothetical protein
MEGFSVPNRIGLPSDLIAPGESKHSRVLRLVSVAALVAAAAVAIGAASRPHVVDVSLSTPELGGLTALMLLVVAGIVGLLIGRNFIAVWVRGPDLEDPNHKKSRIPRVVKILMPLFLLMVVAFIRLWATRVNEQAAKPKPPGTVHIDPLPTATSGGDIGLLAACVGIAVVAAVVAAVLFRRRTSPGLPPAPTEGVVAILDEGLGALLAESDPRRAVIAAYVAMERAMARQGWARRPAEAPTEYLGRVLGVAPGRARDLDQLVGLYQVARFSEHPVTPDMREVAVESVRRLRADLQGST